MKTILSIIPYGLTVHDFFVLRKPILNKPTRLFFNSLPEWAIRGGSGNINPTEDYHQWTGLMDHPEETIFYLFDINPVDEILKEEISNVGVEQLFEGYDWKRLFESIPINEPPHKTLNIPFNVHVVVDIAYENMGDDEFELIVEVLGYLDGRMDLSRV